MLASIIDNVYLLATDCFGIYDLNDDGYISREEMFQMLKNTMVKQPTEEDPDEGIKDIVEIMVKKMVRKNEIVFVTDHLSSATIINH